MCQCVFIFVCEVAGLVSACSSGLSCHLRMFGASVWS